MELDKRLDTYAELVGRYARNSVSLEHMHMVNRGSADGYFEVAKYELWGRKISNRMDEILAVIIQDNAYREQAKFKTYPRPTINPINQLITSPGEADKIAEAAQREADNIMAIAFPSGAEPPLATNDTTTTQTAHSVPPTAPTAAAATIAANHLDHGKQPRPASPSFMMNTIPDNRPGATVNLLLVVNTGHEGNTNSFITPTLVTNCQNCQDNRNTVAFKNNIPEADKQINARLAEIVTRAHHWKLLRPVAWIAMFQTDTSSQTTENTSIRVCTQTKIDPTLTITIETTTVLGKATPIEPTTIVVQRDTLPNTAPKHHFGASGATQPHMIHKLADQNPGQAHRWNHQVQTCSYHPAQSPNQHNTSSHQPVPAHTTQSSPAPSGSEEWAKLLVTRMKEQEYNNREIENRKTYLENIEVYEGTDKQKCLPWVNQLQQAAKCSNTSLRAALLARAGATVFGMVAATPENIDDLEMKKVVLRNFSDIATPTEAAQKLRNMKMTSDQPIASYNYNYAAVHKAAFDINSSEQRMRFALEDYANSLPEYTADKLSYKIVKVNSWIKNLQDAMDHAVKIDQESRQSKVIRNRRNNISELIDTTVNKISDIDINYVTSRQGDSRFNSTMKPGYQREGKDFSPRNRQNDSFWKSRGWNSPRNDNPNFRKINKYKHHAREHRNNIKFEYTISKGGIEIMRTLRNMIDFLKGKTEKVVEDIKRMPKVNPRGMNEVSEDSIATISIEEIQRILKEDINTIYDALVASDYIEEIAEA